MLDQIQKAKLVLEDKLRAAPGFMEYLGLVALEKTYCLGKEIVTKKPLSPSRHMRIANDKEVIHLQKRIRDAALEHLWEYKKTTSYQLMKGIREKIPELKNITFNLQNILEAEWMNEEDIKCVGRTYTYSGS